MTIANPFCPYCKKKLLIPSWGLCESKHCNYLHNQKRTIAYKEKLKNKKDKQDRNVA